MGDTCLKSRVQPDNSLHIYLHQTPPPFQADLVEVYVHVYTAVISAKTLLITTKPILVGGVPTASSHCRSWKFRAGFTAFRLANVDLGEQRGELVRVSRMRSRPPLGLAGMFGKSRILLSISSTLVHIVPVSFLAMLKSRSPLHGTAA